MHFSTMAVLNIVFMGYVVILINKNPHLQTIHNFIDLTLIDVSVPRYSAVS